MGTTHRFTALVWDHPNGGATACLVEETEDTAAFAESRSAALTQLKELLQWRCREQSWHSPQEYGKPELGWIKVDVRPEYSNGERVFPVKETFQLRVPYVRMTDDIGMKLCSMPTLKVRFQYDDDDALVELARHYAQVAVKGLTPQQLARKLPPAAVALEDVVVHVPREERKREQEPDLRPLSLIAEALGATGARGRLSRPWQRDEQVARIAKSLTEARGSVLLLGESGSGKTAVLVEAVRKVERESPSIEPEEDAIPFGPGSVRSKHRFWMTNASRLISGMKYLGQWQERCEQVIGVIDSISGALCVENLLELVRIGGSSPLDSLAAFLLPYIQRGELRLVGEATAAELDACRRLLPAFAAAFTVIELPPFTQKQAVDALDQLAGTWSQNLGVPYERSAVEQVYRLFARFMPYQSFPGRAAGFVIELFDRASKDTNAKITQQSAVRRFIEVSGLPELFLRNDLLLEFDEVVMEFESKVIGQNNPCKTAASIVTTFKAGLNDPARPLGVLLFCGPTGVGKTELARTISEYLFGHGEKKDRLVRLDMSEYAGPGAAVRLIGSPGGEPSELIKRLREQPFTVVLLDEIEKAAPEVFDVLLGVFDEGRLTDRYGRLTTFRSALIIMTSNLGAERAEPFGLSNKPTASYDSEAMSFFRPEFFNRIDAVVTFSSLAQETIEQIVVLELKKIAQREGLHDRQLVLEWDNAVVKKLAETGYDARYGARPLQRTIEQSVVTPLARLLVENARLRKASLRLTLDVTSAIVIREMKA